MCSINFIYNYKDKDNKKLLQGAIKKMVIATTHRGPDTAEFVIKENYALGFNRLEIVGEGLGKQPIFDKPSGIYLICNGEIFNYKILRRKYCNTEHFSTKSDVEIILHLYKKMGEKCIQYLEGQFSFVLFDTSNNKIFIGRDRFGINPLFYYKNKDNFIISSEIKAILSTDIIKKVSLDVLSIAESLFFYGALPPKTCFSNVFQLPPAYFGIYDIKSKKLTTKPYWKLQEAKKKEKSLTVAKERLLDLLTTSVEKRLQGKSMPGVYLSGGLDSSVIAYLVNKITLGKTKFFSIGFSNPTFDESFYQKKVADGLGVNLNQVTTHFEDIVSNLEECIFHVETPLIRTAPVPMLLLSKMVRKENIKFVLCGEGADEMFAGYPVFLKAKSSFEDKWSVLSNFINLFKNPVIPVFIRNTYNKLAMTSQKESLLSQSRKKEIKTKLSQYLLVNQGDRMSMANGIEQCFPFLDSLVVKYAFSLEDELLVNKEEGKVILKKIFKEILPREVIQRKKQGYLAPDDEVIRYMLKLDKFNKLLTQENLKKTDIFDFDFVLNLRQKVLKGENLKAFEANALIFVISTQLLYEIFIEQKKIN